MFVAIISFKKIWKVLGFVILFSINWMIYAFGLLISSVSFFLLAALHALLSVALHELGCSVKMDFLVYEFISFLG